MRCLLRDCEIFAKDRFQLYHPRLPPCPGWASAPWWRTSACPRPTWSWSSAAAGAEASETPPAANTVIVCFCFVTNSSVLQPSCETAGSRSAARRWSGSGAAAESSAAPCCVSAAGSWGQQHFSALSWLYPKVSNILVLPTVELRYSGSDWESTKCECWL